MGGEMSFPGSPIETPDNWIERQEVFGEPEPVAPNESTETDGNSRASHLAWCKRRALQYCDMGDVNQAFASMGSDLSKHPETGNHSGIQLGMMMLMAGHLNTPEKMRKFIEGFN
jgi:hypothetical protein